MKGGTIMKERKQREKEVECEGKDREREGEWVEENRRMRWSVRKRER